MAWNRSGVSLLFSLALGCSCWGQQQKQEAPPPPPTDTALTTLPTPVVKQKKPPTEPAIIEDGGLSIEPIYWLNRAQPDMRGGAAATGFSSIGYPGNANPGLGGELSIPAGHS